MMNQLKLNLEQNKPIIDTKNFKLIFDSIWLDSKNTLQSKAEDYADFDIDDRTHNFKRAGQLMNCSPERALLGFMGKHLISMLDMIDNIDKDKPCPSPEYVREKLGDIRNYLVLLEALFYERRENES